MLGADYDTCSVVAAITGAGEGWTTGEDDEESAEVSASRVFGDGAKAGGRRGVSSQNADSAVDGAGECAVGAAERGLQGDEVDRCDYDAGATSSALSEVEDACAGVY